MVAGDLGLEAIPRQQCPSPMEAGDGAGCDVRRAPEHLVPGVGGAVAFAAVLMGLSEELEGLDELAGTGRGAEREPARRKRQLDDVVERRGRAQHLEHDR